MDTVPLPESTKPPRSIRLAKENWGMLYSFVKEREFNHDTLLFNRSRNTLS